MLILPIFLTVCFHKKNLHNSIFPTLCPWITNTAVLLAVEQSVLSRRGELGGDPCSTKGRANRECAALIFHTAQNENHFDDVPFPLSPSWHLLITSDVLFKADLRGLFCYKFWQFLLQSWNSGREIKPVSVFLLYGKTCNLLVMLRETPGSRGTGLQCTIKSTPWNTPVFLNRELFYY